MTTKLEARIDAEFERRGVKPYVYHFNDHSRKEGGNPHRIWAFGGVTIATQNPNRATIEGLVLEEQRTCRILYNTAKDMLAGLHKRGIYGIAICDNRDQFSRKRDRIGHLRVHAPGGHTPAMRKRGAKAIRGLDGTVRGMGVEGARH